jgi:hypothetical protein
VREREKEGGERESFVLDLGSAPVYVFHFTKIEDWRSKQDIETFFF